MTFLFSVLAMYSQLGFFFVLLRQGNLYKWEKWTVPVPLVVQLNFLFMAKTTNPIIGCATALGVPFHWFVYFECQNCLFVGFFGLTKNKDLNFGPTVVKKLGQPFPSSFRDFPD